MNGARVNGQRRYRGGFGLALAATLGVGLLASGCPTVHRYGPGEGPAWETQEKKAARSRSGVKSTPRKGEGAGDDGRSRGKVRPKVAPGGQLGDGSLRGELLAAALRVLGWRFEFEGLSEDRAFDQHLQAVAVWSGALEPVTTPAPGDLWRSEGGRLAVVERPLAKGRAAVIGPQDKGPVGRYEVDGGTFWRALEAADEARWRGGWGALGMLAARAGRG